MRTRSNVCLENFKEELSKVLNPNLNWNFKVELVAEYYEEEMGLYECWINGDYNELNDFKTNYLNRCHNFYPFKNTNKQIGYLKNATFSDIVNLSKYGLVYPPIIELDECQKGITITNPLQLGLELKLIFDKYFPHYL